MWIALVLIILLIFLSIYGAFLGSQRAKNFFNSLPLSVYWLALAAVLTTGLTAFRRLVRIPGLLLMHIGCILILTGSMWASAAGHKLQKQLFGIDKIPTGTMTIYEGYRENHVTLQNGKQSKLPFSIGLKDFQLEYYQPEYLQIQTSQGQGWNVPVKTSEEFPLGDDFGTVTIIRTFENFKMIIDGDKQTIIDAPPPGSNPALEVQIKDADGTVTTRYVFERFPGHIHPEDKFLMSYHRVISDYISKLQVIKDGKVVAEKSIEVNHPLHFGGYHFYQHAYDAKAGQYSIFMVVSDTGLSLVYAGYLMLGIGVFWRFRLRGFRFWHLFTKRSQDTYLQKSKGE